MMEYLRNRNHFALVSKIVLTWLFLTAGYAFFLFFNVAASVYGYCLDGYATQSGYFGRTLAHYWPFILYTLTVVYLFFAVLMAVYPKNEKNLLRGLKINGTLISAFGLASMIGVAVNAKLGNTPFGMAGGPTLIYPYDNFIFSLLLVFAGSALYLLGMFHKRLALPYAYVEHHGKGLLMKVLRIVFRGLFILIALYFAGATLTLPVTACTDVEFLPGMIFYYIAMAMPSLLFLYYVWGYTEMGDFGKKVNLAKSPVAFEVVAVALVISQIVAHAVSPAFMIEGAAGILPLDFMVSIRLGDYLPLAADVVAPIVAFLHFLLERRRAEKAN